MIILIAESKTMLPQEVEVSNAVLQKNLPLYDAIADAIMASLKDLTLADLSEMTGMSASMTKKLQKYIYEFGYKLTGNQAIEAFTGVVFKALDYGSLSEDAWQRCQRDVRIISSLYGWLRPEDIIKTYRFDFTTRLEEGPSEDKRLNAFWKKNVTMALVQMLQQRPGEEILNLLPSQASDCVDWKLVKRFAKVWKVDFVETVEAEKVKTPNASRLKTLRGLLLRQILTEGLKSASQLTHLAGEQYFCEGPTRYPDHLNFLC